MAKVNASGLPRAHPIEAYAREAYAAGWAASGGPMTARVRAGCTAAVQVAVESADDPDVFKATVDLGKLEGMWALLFQRREQLAATHTTAVTKAWHPLVDEAHITAAVQQFRSRLGLAEADGREVKAEAVAAAGAMLSGISDQPGFADLRAALRDAIAAGRAEGMVDAVAIAAERAHRDGLDWDIGFSAAYADVQHLEDLTADTTTWLGRLVERAIVELARLLADCASTDASEEDTVTAVSGEVAGPRISFIEFLIEWAMTGTASAGVLDVLRSEGVAFASWISVGDSVVCPACKDNEDRNPWPLEEFPICPDHPGCRCTPEADFALGRYDTWFA